VSRSRLSESDSVKCSDLRSTNRSPSEKNFKSDGKWDSPLSSNFSHPSLVRKPFLSEKKYKNGIDSVDWPPIGSTLCLPCGDVKHGDCIGLQASELPPKRLSMGHLFTGAQGNASYLSQKPPPASSPVKQLEELHSSVNNSLSQILEGRKFNFRRDEQNDSRVAFST
jgi:hypothetical protein